ncbi:MAG: oligosaccharide flippase family protein [Chloroflexi bacterium]|nr:oligosaccharide flippase family protein [Chloroflexota bacterium]
MTFVKNWAAQAGSSLLSIPLSIVFVTVIARRLGPEEYGVYQLALSFPGLLVTAVPLGMNVYFSRDLAQHPEDARRYASHGFGLAFLTAIVVYLAIQGIATFMGFNESARLAISVSGLSATIASISLLSGAMFRAFERMQLDAYVSLAERTAAAGLGVVAAYIWGTSFALVCVLLVTGMARFACSQFLLRKQIGSFPLKIDVRQSWSYVRTGWPFLVAGYGDTFYNYIGPTILAKVSSTLEVGTYASAWRLILLLSVFAISFANVTLPLLARTALHGRERIRVLMQGALPILVFTTAAGASLVALLAGPISGLVYGARFTGTPAVVTLLVFMLPSTFVRFFTGNVLMSINEQTFITKLLLGVSVVSVGVNLGLSSVYGAIGAGAALLICDYLVTLGMLLRLAAVRAGANLSILGLAWLAGAAPGLAALSLPVPVFAQVAFACVTLGVLAFFGRGMALRHLAMTGVRMST